MAEDAQAKPGPAEQLSGLYEDFEARAGRAGESLVSSSGFASLLARAAENAAAVTRLSGDAMDILLRNLRLAGRRDVVSLSRQLARTEDKLERVLQEVEELRDELERGGRSQPARTQPAGSEFARSQSNRDSKPAGNSKPASRTSSRRRKASS
ncbi:MAG TPA: hypothetical protein VG186_03670 [Solirubrobacteraceae bacterium]|jgi:hypothetical protein|nr:hypothetical protein [Solirubrobacteraceae bacterium]